MSIIKLEKLEQFNENKTKQHIASNRGINPDEKCKECKYENKS